MKGLKLIIAIVGLTLFAASCKNNMNLTKRHYTKGYYFHKTKSLEQPTAQDGVAAQKEKAADLKSVNAEPLKNKVAEPEVKGGLVETPVFNGFSKEEQKKNPEVSAKHVQKRALAENISLKQKSKTGTSVQKKGSKVKRGNSDANLVLLVILCLFPILSLIAVYIHDGHSITTNFWLTLILHLTIIGYIIFSLLVILDVVDLA